MGFEIFTCGHSYTALIDTSKTNPFIRILAAVLATDIDQLCLYGHADNGPLQYIIIRVNGSLDWWQRKETLWCLLTATTSLDNYTRFESI